MRKRGDRAWYRPRRVHGRDCFQVVAIISGRSHTALVDTEREAIAEVDRLRRTLKGDELPPRDWDEAIEAYISARDMKPASAQTVRYRLASIGAALNRHPMLLALEDADTFRKAREAAGRSPTTIFHEMRAVVSLQAWMHRKGWVRAVTWEGATMPAPRRREEHLHPAEVGAFLRMAERLSKDPTLGDPKCNRLAEDWKRWAAAAWIFMFGPRTGEMQRLRVRDIDLLSGVVWVYGTKSKSSRRAFVIASDRGLEVVRDTFRGVDPDGLAFPTGRMGADARGGPDARTKWFEMRCKLTCELAGIHVVSPHVLRHTVATEALVNDAEIASVQALLGHGSSRITTDTYSHAVAAVHSRGAARAIGAVLDRVVAGEAKVKIVR